MSCRLRTSSSIVCSMFARSSSSSDFIPPVPSTHLQRAWRRRRASRVGVVAGVQRRAPLGRRGSADRGPPWPTVPVRPVRTDSVPSSGPSVVGRHARQIHTPRRSPWQSSSSTRSRCPADRRELRHDHRPRAGRAVRRGRPRARADRRRRGEGGDRREDGRDVDEVHRHRRDHREGRGRPPRGDAVKSREAGGQGHANATARSRSPTAAARCNTNAQITGKAASMGEGVVAGVLDALIKDFTGKLSKL